MSIWVAQNLPRRGRRVSYFFIFDIQNSSQIFWHVIRFFCTAIISFDVLKHQNDMISKYWSNTCSQKSIMRNIQSIKYANYELPRGNIETRYPLPFHKRRKIRRQWSRPPTLWLSQERNNSSLVVNRFQSPIHHQVFL